MNPSTSLQDIQGLYIAGCWHNCRASLPVIDPSSGIEIGRIARGTADDVDRAVKAAQAAFAGEWGRLDAAARGRLLGRFAELIRRDLEQLAKLESTDVGKPLSQARTDATVAARYFEYYGGAADKVHGDTIPFAAGCTVMTVWVPHGVTGHITPWNYPMQMMGRSIAPSLAMGNAIVLKPAEDTSLTAIAFAQLAEEAGLPPGTFNVVTGLGEEAGAALTAHPGIRHISFTGSPEVGTLVQTAAARNTIPVTLELGGKSPQIVFADADLDLAADTIVKVIVQSAGQTCSAGSRVVIEDTIYDAFIERLIVRFEKTCAGPASSDRDLGPVVNRGQLERIERYIALAKQTNLPTLAEGSIEASAPSGGYYVKPTLIGNVPANHPLAQEEIFGPVLVAIRVRDEAEALQVANDTPYGLVAGIWTKDIGRALRLARGVECGQVYINNYGAGGGVELPFGGVKRSGHGREKGFAALYGFGALKTITIRHD
jgi:aldehyde dehydrogenase (NAD+)